jgi:hypothetical protein
LGLLKREKTLWQSPEELIERFRNANNRALAISEGFSRIRDEWDGRKQEYGYDFYVTQKIEHRPARGAMCIAHRSKKASAHPLGVHVTRAS